MFTPKEITFLKTELNGYIDKAQQWLDKEDIDPARREQIESRLITTVSIVNKLEHTKAEDEEKSQLVRVLIVDDTESMRGIVKHFFSECGFKQIDVAEDGVRALSMMKRAYQEKDPYKLVISDWEMPNMTGLELLKKVRIDKQLWQTPFYLLTTLSEKKYIFTALNNGVTGYMVKPVNQKIINEKFKEYLTN